MSASFWPDAASSPRQLLLLWAAGNVTGGTLAYGNNQADNTAVVLTQIDVSNRTLTEGSEGSAQIGPIGNANVQFWRFFVYASSQGYFQWTGALWVPPGYEVSVFFANGDWQSTATGFIYPYGGQTP